MVVGKETQKGLGRRGWHTHHLLCRGRGRAEPGAHPRVCSPGLQSGRAWEGAGRAACGGQAGQGALGAAAAGLVAAGPVSEFRSRGGGLLLGEQGKWIRLSWRKGLRTSVRESIKSA